MKQQITTRMRLGSSLAKALALICLPLSLLSAEAQNNERSPYSRYGYGSMSALSTAGSRAMGGLSVSLRDANIINSANPASYTGVDSLTFIMDVAVSLRQGWLSQSGSSDSRLLGNLEYINVLMPMGKHLAFSAGVMPWATTGYRFGSQEQLSAGEHGRSSIRTYSGSGTYNNLYLGLSARTPLKGLSVGANAAYLFGVTTHERRVLYNSAGSINPVFVDQMRINGFRADAGAQYEYHLDEVGKHQLVFGATASLGTGMKVEEIENRVAINTATSNTVVLKNDTITTTGHFTLPLQLGFGASYRVKDKLLVGADIQYSKWSGVKYRNRTGTLVDREGQTIGRLRDSYGVALGAELIPSARSRNILRRSRYRFGLNAATSSLELPDVTGTYSGYYELGASAGIALPLVDMRSFITLAVNYKYLRPQQSSMIREHYLGVTLGITFNEGWFRKARVH